MDNAMYLKGAAGTGAPAQGGYLEAVRELRRIIVSGGKLYMTVPFGRYENHGWFQQFDSTMLDSLVEAFEPVQHIETIFEYGPTGWRKSTRESCAECSFFDVHASRYFDRGSKVDFPPDYQAAEGAVACLEMWR
jgi:hypothetical protein